MLALEHDGGVKTIECGWVGSDALKAALYSAADLYVHPTRADSLPLVLQESLACGTQAVSFNVGGVSDLARPGETGYLAAPENVADLSRGIVEMLEDDASRRRMAGRCRDIAEAEYSLELQVVRHIELYRNLTGCAEKPAPAMTRKVD